MKDIFETIKSIPGPLGQYQGNADGYFMFPKLEGEIGPEMVFNGKKVLNWSLNNYLGLANHPEVRKADAEGAAKFGLAAPMGARMMSGDTVYHKKLEQDLADFVGKPAAYLMNFGYQGMVSIIDVMCSRFDVIVYDSEAHACIMDGIFLHKAKGGKSFVYPHNDIDRCEKMLKMAENYIDKEGGPFMIKIHNPIPIDKIGDPYVLYWDGMYYMYATSHVQGFYCWTSRDLATIRTSFSAGETLAFACQSNSTVQSSDDTVTALLVVRDSDGNVVDYYSGQETWSNMWSNKLYVGELTRMPETAGDYTLEIYFNGKLVDTGNPITFKVTG